MLHLPCPPTGSDSTRQPSRKPFSKATKMRLSSYLRYLSITQKRLKTWLKEPNRHAHARLKPLKRQNMAG